MCLTRAACQLAVDILIPVLKSSSKLLRSQHTLQYAATFEKMGFTQWSCAVLCPMKMHDLQPVLVAGKGWMMVCVGG